MVREKKKVLEGIKLGSKKSINDTSLTFECKKNNIERVELLINNGKNINKKNKDGDTPLIIACKNNNMELVKCLLNHKEIDINLKSDYDINSIMVASYFNNKDIVDYLIENNANIEMQDRKNNLPLHIACYLNSDIEIIKSLGNNNNNLSTIKNLYGYTPLEITKELKNKAATDLLTGSIHFYTLLLNKKKINEILFNANLKNYILNSNLKINIYIYIYIYIFLKRQRN